MSDYQLPEVWEAPQPNGRSLWQTSQQQVFALNNRLFQKGSAFQLCPSNTQWDHNHYAGGIERAGWCSYDAYRIKIKWEIGLSDFVAINPNWKFQQCWINQVTKTLVFLNQPIFSCIYGEIWANWSRQILLNWTENWPFHKTGAAPLGGGFGHFFPLCSWKIVYAINRYSGSQTPIDLLDSEIGYQTFIFMAWLYHCRYYTWSWHGLLAQDKVWDRRCEGIQAFAGFNANRPAVKRAWK